MRSAGSRASSIITASVTRTDRKKMKPIQVGLLGIGTVGGGTFAVLQRNQEEIQRRAGRPIRITMVADLDAERLPVLAAPLDETVAGLPVAVPRLSLGPRSAMEYVAPRATQCDE